MTPEQLSAAIDTWVWIDQQIRTYGPGLVLAAACVAAAWARSKARGWREQRAVRRQLHHERQQMARLSKAINDAPLIPTQRGQDDDLLDQCWNTWNADTRKETDQP